MTAIPSGKFGVPMQEELLTTPTVAEKNNTMEAHGFTGIDDAKRCLATLIDRGLKFCGVTPSPVSGEQFKQPTTMKAKKQKKSRHWKKKNRPINVKLIGQQAS